MNHVTNTCVTISYTIVSQLCAPSVSNQSSEITEKNGSATEKMDQPLKRMDQPYFARIAPVTLTQSILFDKREECEEVDEKGLVITHPMETDLDAGLQGV